VPESKNHRLIINEILLNSKKVDNWVISRRCFVEDGKQMHQNKHLKNHVKGVQHVQKLLFLRIKYANLWRPRGNFKATDDSPNGSKYQVSYDHRSYERNLSNCV